LEIVLIEFLRLYIKPMSVSCCLVISLIKSKSLSTMGYGTLFISTSALLSGTVVTFVFATWPTSYLVGTNYILG